MDADKATKLIILTQEMIRKRTIVNTFHVRVSNNFA